MSRTPSPRPFRLSDAMALIVATAVGLALIKFIDGFNGGIFDKVQKEELFTGNWPDRLEVWAKLLMLCLLVVVSMILPWSVALLGLRLRQPRPRLRRVWLQPGTAACLATALLMLQKGILIGCQAIVGRCSGIPWNKIVLDIDIPAGSGAIILGIWIMSYFAGVSRPEKSWIDRVGRFLGVLMIVIYLTGAFVPELLESMEPRFELPSFPPTPTFDPSLLPPPVFEDPNLPSAFPELPPREEILVAPVPPTAPMMPDVPIAPPERP